ncbi:hypothetical protein H8B06_13820 [Sphingobacterium sp. DN00404]|uniref:Uncharacterized protein n=1 Tax=Sphingobacterium micropteri TaxID=2763501 RepID=A0ABR7YRS4_9SPHI|nr:hypothetical protein [Sphingobacterium micropteri]MBD1433911.1 hypothetical protein [Sphingobacterium micropteri]
MTKEQAYEKLELPVGTNLQVVRQKFNQMHNEFLMQIDGVSFSPAMKQRMEQQLEELKDAYTLLNESESVNDIIFVNPAPPPLSPSRYSLEELLASLPKNIHVANEADRIILIMNHNNWKEGKSTLIYGLVAAVVVGFFLNGFVSLLADVFHAPHVEISRSTILKIIGFASLSFIFCNLMFALLFSGLTNIIGKTIFSISYDSVNIQSKLMGFMLHEASVIWTEIKLIEKQEKPPGINFHLQNGEIIEMDSRAQDRDLSELKVILKQYKYKYEYEKCIPTTPAYTNTSNKKEGKMFSIQFIYLLSAVLIIGTGIYVAIHQ